MITNNLESKTQILDDESSILVETTNSNLNDKKAQDYLANIGSNKEKIEYLRNGIKFRVIVYEKNNGAYYDHKDYTTGELFEPLNLVVGESYTIVVYTFGNENLPSISDSEKENINTSNVRFGYDDSLAFVKQDFILDKNIINKSIDVTLRYCFSFVGIAFRSLGSDASIDHATYSIEGGIISSFSSAKINLRTGKLQCVEDCNSEKIYVQSSDLEDGEHYRFFVFDGYEKQVLLDANIRVLGVDKKIKSTISLSAGKRIFFNTDIRVCGAYTGQNKTNFKRFMCNDLGGNVINLNQTDIRENQHGNVYVWGVKEPILYRDLYLEYLRNGTTEDANERYRKIAKAKNPPTKQEDFIDPCPGGWHVPTIKEWRSVYENNYITNVGDHNNKDYTEAYPLTLGYKLGENLILPASGRRDYIAYDDTLVGAGLSFHWTSNRRSSSRHADSFIIGIGSEDDERDIDKPKISQEADIIINYIYDGLPIRCMKND